MERLAFLRHGLWPNVVHKLWEQRLPQKVECFHSMSPVFLILLQVVCEGQNDAGEGKSPSNITQVQQTTIDRHDVNATNNDGAQPAGSDDDSESNKEESPGEFESHSQIPCL